MFTIFDRDALKGIKDGSTVYRSKFNTSGNYTGQGLQGPHADALTTMDENIQRWTEGARPHYSDEIPPFDITITFMNEYGQSSEMSIYGVELTNEGMGLSIDDITTEKASSFVARGLSDMGAKDHIGR